MRLVFKAELRARKPVHIPLTDTTAADTSTNAAAKAAKANAKTSLSMAPNVAGSASLVASAAGAAAGTQPTTLLEQCIVNNSSSVRQHVARAGLRHVDLTQGMYHLGCRWRRIPPSHACNRSSSPANLQARLLPHQEAAWLLLSCHR
jgi:hypothetical protein